MSTSRPVDLNEPRESELVYINNRNAYCAKKREQKQHQRRHLEQAKLLFGARSAAQKATQGERNSRPSFLSKWLTFSSPPPSFPVPPIATASTPSAALPSQPPAAKRQRLHTPPAAAASQSNTASGVGAASSANAAAPLPQATHPSAPAAVASAQDSEIQTLKSEIGVLKQQLAEKAAAEAAATKKHIMVTYIWGGC